MFNNLVQLPDDTKMFSGFDDKKENLDFYKKVEPEKIKTINTYFEKSLEKGITIGEEKQNNVYLKCKNSKF